MLVAAGGALHAQSPTPADSLPPIPFSVGILGGFALHYYNGTVDIGANPALGQGFCGVLQSGTASGIVPGIFGEYTLNQELGLGARVVMEGTTGMMTAPAPGVTEYRRDDQTLVTVESEQQYDISIDGFSAELYATYTLPGIPLMLSFGPKVHLATGSTYKLREEIVAPSDLTFSNGTNQLEFSAGDLGTPLRVGLIAGAGLPIRMSRRLELRPEIAVSTYFNSFTPAGDVLDASARGALAVRYIFQPSPPEPPPPPPAVAPLPPPLAALTADIRAYGLDETRQEIPQVELTVNERIMTRETALLPYLFFPENSSVIARRYRRTSTPPAWNDPIGNYRRILDIIGERLKANPSARITLIGTTSNSGAEQNNQALAAARAEAVKSYLVELWRIDPSRVITQGRLTPDQPSNNSRPQGEEENRRVEIQADETILAPIITGDTIRSFSSPGIRYAMTIDAEAGIADWGITMMIDGRRVRSLSGELTEQSRISDQFTTSELERLSHGAPLSYGLAVNDKSGAQITTGTQTIGVRIDRRRTDAPIGADSTLSYGGAIIFDFNSAQLRADSREALSRLRSRLPSSTRIAITGYADETGDVEYNRRLSLARARAVAAELSSFSPVINGAGEDTILYPNDTPEGRFYSRSVRITVLPAISRLGR